MQYPSLIGHSAELCRIIKKSSQPADALASDYMRSRKYIGSHDRRFISEVTFFALRALSLCEYVSNALWKECGIPNVENVALCHDIGIVCVSLFLGEKLKCFTDNELLENLPHRREILSTLFKEKLLISDENVAELWHNHYLIHEKELIDILEGVTINETLMATVFCLPEWIITTLKQQGQTYHDIRNLALSLLFPAPLIIRVKKPSENRNNVKKILEKEGIYSELTSLSPAGLVIRKRVALQQMALYREGMIEVHDEGSQLIGYAVNPNDNDIVLDACAGAGGKSLHIADLQNDSGVIISTDIEYKRLKEISIRASRAGYSSIRSILLRTKIGNPELVKYKGRCDLVLVDAPCSGMGTVRRMPMAKWRTTPKLLEKLSTNQRAILTHNAQYVKIGGSIIYATCSFLPQENEEVVRDFLRDNPAFIPDPIKDVFAHNNINIHAAELSNYFLTLYPSIHKTDGFFLARMKKVE